MDHRLNKIDSIWKTYHRLRATLHRRLSFQAYIDCDFRKHEKQVEVSFGIFFQDQKKISTWDQEIYENMEEKEKSSWSEIWTIVWIKSILDENHITGWELPSIGGCRFNHTSIVILENMKNNSNSHLELFLKIKKKSAPETKISKFFTTDKKVRPVRNSGPTYF